MVRLPAWTLSRDKIGDVNFRKDNLFFLEQDGCEEKKPCRLNQGDFGGIRFKYKGLILQQKSRSLVQAPGRRGKLLSAHAAGPP
jgi:hypothetical protein